MASEKPFFSEPRAHKALGDSWAKQLVVLVCVNLHTYRIAIFFRFLSRVKKTLFRLFMAYGRTHMHCVSIDHIATKAAVTLPR